MASEYQTIWLSDVLTIQKLDLSSFWMITLSFSLHLSMLQLLCIWTWASFVTSRDFNSSAMPLPSDRLKLVWLTQHGGLGEDILQAGLQEPPDF